MFAMPNPNRRESGPINKGRTMKHATINIYRYGNGSWCQSTWVDGEFDNSGPLDVDDNASEAEAARVAREGMVGDYYVSVMKVTDMKGIK